MKIYQTKKFQIRDAIITLRNPTNEEFNNYYNKRFEGFGYGKNKDNSFCARVEFFDLLLLNIENLEDESGPIAADQKDKIPAKWKNEIIYKAFDESETIEKN